jgi:hypothetical protein
MTTPVNVLTARQSMALSVQTLERSSTSLQYKANWLRQHRSTDPIQQMQTDAIVDLCDAVRQIQQALSALPIIIPDVGAVREAASNTVTSTTAKSLLHR